MNQQGKRERLVGIARSASDPGAGSGFVTFDDIAFLLNLIRDMADPDECSYDHHAYCQTHSLHESPCPFGTAQALLTDGQRIEEKK